MESRTYFVGPAQTSWWKYRTAQLTATAIVRSPSWIQDRKLVTRLMTECLKVLLGSRDVEETDARNGSQAGDGDG
jgi:hypothetical protein